MTRRMWMCAISAAAIAALRSQATRLRAAEVGDLKERLLVGLRPQLPAHREFVDRVVELVQQDRLPLDVVMQYLLWARKKKYRPMPYFERALRDEAERRGVEI